MLSLPFVSADSSPASSRTSPPPPYPTPEWLTERVSAAHRIAQEAHAIASDTRDESRAGVERIERAIGVSPDPAKGIEGTGLSLSIAKMLKRHEGDDAERAVIAREIAVRKATRNAILTGAGLVVGLLGGIVAILKAFGASFLH